MVGLSIILEGQKNSIVNNKTPQVISKTTMTTTTTTINKAASSFLDQCCLCKQKLLSSKDIYMYRGDKAFCSEDCRYRQIFMDEEETVRSENCAMAAIKPTSPSSSSGSRDRSKGNGRVF